MNKVYTLDGVEFNTLPEYLDALANSDKYYNSYLPWTNADDGELQSLKSSMTVKELSFHFKRIPGASSSRIRKIEKKHQPVQNSNLSNREQLEQFEEFFASVLDGYHPLTGEVFGDDSVWRSENVRRTMQEFLDLQSKLDTDKDDGSSCIFPF